MSRILTYSEKDTWVHRLSGVTKLLFFLLWSVVGMLTYDTRVLAVMLIISIVLFILINALPGDATMSMIGETADEEYVAQLRRVFADNDVQYQMAELGKVDQGGGGTIAYIPARFGMDVIDLGVPLHSMHAPWETAAKTDLYEAYRAYQAFLRDM